MVGTTPSGPQFEDEVRNIARNLYSNNLGQGSEIVEGRERDGVFWNGSFYTVVEATTLRTRDKAETDGKKTHDLVIKLRQAGHMAQGLLVTLHEPTPDQKDVIKARKFDRTTKIISFDELRSQLFDSLSYINNREKKRFGSVYDHVGNNFSIPLSDFVEPTISLIDKAEFIDFRLLMENIINGGRYVLIAEYGVGKSMILRHLFHNLVKTVRSKKHFRTPIAINLREHLGQTEPVELLERHARASAVNPQNLVAAWNAGYVDLLIDGFDELSTRGWTGDIRRLKEYRRTSHSVVRKLIKETPKNSAVVIAGRDAYFDSIGEMREALGVPQQQFSILRVFPFDERQATEFLKKKDFSGVLPEWIPTRPLLLTYLATKGLLHSAVNAELSGDFPRGSAWLSLIEMIASRESEQLEGVDKDSLTIFLGAVHSISKCDMPVISMASLWRFGMSRCYTQITLADRRRLHHMVAAKVPVNEMARQLGRHRSTIYREIRRNTFRDRELPDYDGYYSTVANDTAKDRRRRLRKLRRHPTLRTEIINQLEARWSPEQIAGRLLSDGLSRIRVCKETIYRFIYSKEDYGLGLYQYLPEARRKRRPMRSRKPRDGAFPATHRISQRPDFVGDRSRFGHWEGDLLIFERPLGHANVTTLVERKSRYTVLIKNPSRHSRPIMDKIIRAFSPLPAFARQSFTFDRGTEFAGFRALEDGIGACSWFCDPSAPWQKGTVENTNKRIRRYLPGTTDLAVVSQRDLLHLTRDINDQPRKCLGYRTPSEVFMAHLLEDS